MPAKWYEGLILRNTKEIKTRGELVKKLVNNYKKDGKSVTQKDLANVADLSDLRLKAFLEGMFEDIPDSSLDKILAAIDMDKAAFAKFCKNTSIPSVGLYAKAPPPTQDPAPPVRSREVPKPVATAQADANERKILIENYVEEPFMIVFTESENKVEIHPNYHSAPAPKPGQKILFLHNAVAFGGKVVPGKVGK